MTSPQEFNCIFCKDFFNNKEELQVHFRKHGDPKFNQSVKNSKSDSSEMGSRVEQGVEGEVVSCDVCPEIFPTISKAITHKHKVHPDHDAKYFCPWCGKLFTMKHLYNKHVQSTHDVKEEDNQTGFHCDYCEVDFFMPSAMLYHNKFFHRQDTELAAIGHSKKLKLCNKEPLQIYYCPFCGEEYSNKVNLHKHMGDDHIDENQSPEDVLRCPLCDAMFYHLDAYELHLTFHSTDDMYGEENELANEITEFSLETVSPIMEKIENESLDGETVDSSQIEDFLQQAMNETNDQDNSNDGSLRKKKKHKKHKKSKKAAITLDEFLTMNTDVFGEGLDFQGIEEVPTQIVAKTLNKKLQKNRPGPKPKLPSADLEKLKKQGIVVKKNSAKNPTVFRGVKINKKPINNAPDYLLHTTKNDNLEQTKQNAHETPNAILSKLLNQSNSQIKIIKKSAEDSTNTELLPKDVQESNKAEVPQENDTTKSGIEEKNEDANTTEENLFKETLDRKLSSGDIATQNDPQDTKNNCLFQNITKVSEAPNKMDSIDAETQDSHKSFKNNVDPESINLKTDKSGNTEKLDILRNISQHITIKSMSSSSKMLNEEKPQKVVSEKVENFGSHTDMESTNQQNSALDNKAAGKTDEINTNKNSLNPLKHLSHLITVKPVSQTKGSASPKTSEKYTTEDKTDIDDMPNENNDKSYIDKELEHQDVNNITKVKKEQNQNTNIEAFKNLSKHITIKSLSQSSNNTAKVLEESVKDTSDSDIDHNVDSQKLGITNIARVDNTSQIMNFPKNSFNDKSNTNNKSIETKSLSRQPAKVLNKESPISSNVNNGNTNKNPSCADILKQLPNVTAKSVNTARSLKQVSPQPSLQSANKPIDRIIETNIKKERKQEEVEIFNIDDSDDEIERTQERVTKAQILNQIITTPKQIECNKKVDKSRVLKSISKHITIKPSNPQKPIKNESLRDFDMTSEEEMDLKDSDGEIYDSLPQNIKQSVNDKNTTLQKKLQILTGVTVKSNTSSRLSNFSHNLENVDNDTHIENYDSSSNMSDKVKISELPDDFTSDDDVPLLKTNAQAKSGGNVIVQEPDNTDSDNEAHSNSFEDIESQIKPSMLKKTIEDSNKRPSCLNNLKNVTIKSSKESTEERDNIEPAVEQKEKQLIPNQNKQLSIRPFRQSVPHDEFQEPNSMQTIQDADRVSTQKNTVNKEVTVQTFKTQTVIQEITTTVTKTIRTVNQTVKQEMRKMNASVPSRAQKAQGIAPNQQNKNFQGMTVRPAHPQLGPRIRNANPSSRPVLGSTVRPSNQALSVRPGVNLARPSNPNIANVKRPTASSSSSYKPVIGKPLKISPNALVPSSKRPAIEDINRPFSCFKKPKESLIPGVDLGDQTDGSVEHSVSSSHMSKSNFTSTSKSVKSNSVVTSTRMKSEFHASSEHLSKLNNLAGLKVVKASQMKQAAKVEEKTEVSTSKRSTLEAIEKLQKQGLLVKKPRLGETEFNEHFNSDDDGFNDT